MQTTTGIASPQVASNPDLDYLLAQVAEAVQLTNDQYNRATGHYEAVGDWLAAPGGPLAAFAPTIYPQGSMRLGTTVKPRGEVEYDLDFVCEVRGGAWTAMKLYDAVHDRLHAHETYRAKLKKKKRCLCLEYAGDFHMDIIPAIADPSRGGTCIKIPDTALASWTPSNPRGYADWFKQRSTVLVERLVKAAATEPLPIQSDASEKLPLALAVQLMKRARDVAFNGADDAPRSIILTTLSGNYYSGGTCVVSAIIEVARAIQRLVRAAAPGPISVVNPSNPDEDFTDGITGERQRALGSFASMLEARVVELTQLRGERLRLALEKLFDGGPGAKVHPVAAAFQKYAELQKSRRDAGTLTSSAKGLGVVAPLAGGFRVPSNTYFGD